MKCATIGCPNTPVTAMHWDAEEGNAVENICQECADSYSRRPWLVKRVRFVRLATAAVIVAAGLALVAPAVATDGGTRVPCATDEPNPGTDPQGCVWDARHMGNGIGRSLVVRPSGRVIYVSHARAHFLLTGVVL